MLATGSPLDLAQEATIQAKWTLKASTAHRAVLDHSARQPVGNRCIRPVDIPLLRPLRKGGKPAVSVDSETGCWIWQGALTSKGYPQRRTDKNQELVHRAVFEFCTRPLEAGEQVHHRCERKSCVNPAHLEAHPHLTHARHHAGDTSRAALILWLLRDGPQRFAYLDAWLKFLDHRTGAGTALLRMSRRGEVVKLERGLYALPNEVVS